MQLNLLQRKSKTERTMAMNNYRFSVPKTLWLGTIVFAAVLVGWTPSCKAQEVSPAIFTATGVEDAYPAKKVVTKKATKVQTSAHSNSTLSNQGVAEKRKTQPARKQNAGSAPSV
jgi:hypothetical protein